jgi:hypothetical protein
MDGPINPLGIATCHDRLAQTTIFLSNPACLWIWTSIDACAFAQRVWDNHVERLVVLVVSTALYDSAMCRGSNNTVNRADNALLANDWAYDSDVGLTRRARVRFRWLVHLVEIHNWTTGTSCPYIQQHT